MSHDDRSRLRRARSPRLGLIFSVLFTLLLAETASATLVNDLVGDAGSGGFTSYDILSIDAQFTSSSITFTIVLATTPVAPSVNAMAGLTGFIDIDIDSNPNTGITSNIDTIGSGYGSTNLGMEYSIDLFTESSNPGFVTLKDPISVPIVTSQVAITYGINFFSVTVPLSSLGNDDGLLSYAVVVGDSAFATDQASDPLPLGALPAMSSPAAIPEPSTALLLALGLAGLTVSSRRSGVDDILDSAGNSRVGLPLVP